MSPHTDISPLSRMLMRIDAAADGTRASEGIATGFPSLDDRLGGGVRAGDLIVLAGDTGAGKSALALAIALRARAAGRGAVLLTGEMSPERVHERVLALEGRVRIDDLRRGTVTDEMRAALGAAALRLREQLPVISAMPGQPDAIAALLPDAPPTELVVVDSLRCLCHGRAPHHEALASAASELKRLAMERSVAVVVTAHLAARAPGAGDARPTLDDLGALGVVQQTADVVLGLYREDMYEPGRADEGATELLVLKNRNGGTSYVDLFFYRQWLRFEDMVEPDR